MTVANGIHARLERAERDIERLLDKKANMDDVIALRGEIREVKRILVWFMGVAATALIAGFGIVIGLLAG